MAADLIFTGGRIYTVLPDGRRMVPATASGEAASSEDTSSGAGIGTEDGPPATAVAVHGGRIVAVGTDDEIRDLAGGPAETVHLDGRPLLPGFQDAHVHPAFAGITMLRCDLDGAEDLAVALDRISGLRRRASGPGVDRRQRLADGVVSRRHPVPRAAGQRGPGPPGLPDEPGRARRLGQLPGPGAGRPRPPPTPDPADGRIERRRGRRAAGHAARGRGAAGGPARARPQLRRTGPRAAAGPAAPARAGHHRLAGRHRGGVPGLPGPAPGLPGRRAGRLAHRPGRRSPSGGTAAGAPSSSTTCSTGGRKARRAGSGPASSRSCRTGSQRTSPPG